MRHKTGGRTKGTPNKVTTRVREAIAEFAEANVGRLQTWLDAVAAKDPGKAAELFVKVLDYHIPRLARTEVKEESSERTQIHQIVFVPPPDRTDK
jgi:hypothetical protein